MADYISLRLAAARLGVTMAFFALLGGLAEKARAAISPGDRAVPSAGFLTDVSVPSSVVLKLDSALASLEHKLSTSFETTHKLNQTFLKIKSADTEFLKIRSADTSFLKIDDADTSFLKIDDANSEFLKIDSTAANASELGGLSPQAFFQGNGHVVSGAVSSPSASPQQLLALPGGIIVVTVAANADAVFLNVANATGATLPAVQDLDGGAPTGNPLAPGANQIQLTSARIPTSCTSRSSPAVRRFRTS